MKLSIFCPFGLKTPIHAPKIGGLGAARDVAGIFTDLFVTVRINQSEYG